MGRTKTLPQTGQYHRLLPPSFRVIYVPLLWVLRLPHSGHCFGEYCLAVLRVLIVPPQFLGIIARTHKVCQIFLTRKAGENFNQNGKNFGLSGKIAKKSEIFPGLDKTRTFVL